MAIKHKVELILTINVTVVKKKIKFLAVSYIQKAAYLYLHSKLLKGGKNKGRLEGWNRRTSNPL